VTKQQRTFSVKFNVDAARFILYQGYSIPKAIRSMDVKEAAI